LGELGGDGRLPLFQAIRHRPVGAGRQRSALRSRQHYSRLSTELCDHAFRSTGITVYLENGDTLEKVRRVKSAAKILFKCSPSACNTSGAQSENAEALSGLARAFFYGSAAAVKLTARRLCRAEAEPGARPRGGLPTPGAPRRASRWRPGRAWSDRRRTATRHSGTTAKRGELGG